MRIPDVAAGAIIAAAIAAMASFVGLVISKENKVSEFRQAWIDALRSELANLVAHMLAIRDTFDRLMGREPTEEMVALIAPDVLEANKAATSIRLRLNAAEDDCSELLQVVEEFEALLNEYADLSPKDETKLSVEGDRLEREIVRISRGLLKREWIRVKEGERIYQMATAVMIAGIVVGSLVALGSLIS